MKCEKIENLKALLEKEAPFVYATSYGDGECYGEAPFIYATEKNDY